IKFLLDDSFVTTVAALLTQLSRLRAAFGSTLETNSRHCRPCKRKSSISACGTASICVERSRRLSPSVAMQLQQLPPTLLRGSPAGGPQEDWNWNQNEEDFVACHCEHRRARRGRARARRGSS